jgi:hypothetical protein
MKELVTVAASFVIVVGLAIYMYEGNQKHTTAVNKNNDLEQVVEKNHEELKQELEELKTHVAIMDSIYHKQ